MFLPIILFLSYIPYISYHISYLIRFYLIPLSLSLGVLLLHPKRQIDRLTRKYHYKKQQFIYIPYHIQNHIRNINIIPYTETRKRIHQTRYSNIYIYYIYITHKKLYYYYYYTTLADVVAEVQKQALRNKFR